MRRGIVILFKKHIPKGNVFFDGGIRMKIGGIDGRNNLAGERIRELRRKAGWTQAQLAAKLQTEGYPIEQKAISRIEAGYRVIPDYELPVFAAVLNTTIEELLAGSPGRQGGNCRRTIFGVSLLPPDVKKGDGLHAR